MRYITTFLFGAVLGAMIHNSLLAAIGVGLGAVVICKILSSYQDEIK
jgi:hypothetical protein